LQVEISMASPTTGSAASALTAAACASSGKASFSRTSSAAVR
jgi:hypothetical protein